MLLLHARMGAVEDGHVGAHVLQIEDFGLQTVVDVGGQVGDFVGEIDELRLQRRALVEKILRELGVLRRFVVPGVLDDALAHAEGEIESRVGGVALFEVLDDAQRVQVVVEAQAVLAHAGVEGAFAGVAERRMTDVMDQRQRLGQLLIEA